MKISWIDITQTSDRQIDESSQISEKEMSVDSANKEMLYMMLTMYSHLEENGENE